MVLMNLSLSFSLSTWKGRFIRCKFWLLHLCTGFDLMAVPASSCSVITLITCQYT